MLTFFLSGEIVSGRVLGTQNIILAKGRNGYQSLWEQPLPGAVAWVAPGHLRQTWPGLLLHLRAKVDSMV